VRRRHARYISPGLHGGHLTHSQENITVREPIARELDCVCWCGRTTLRVPQADVLAGRTRTCRRTDCVDPTCTE